MSHEREERATPKRRRPLPTWIALANGDLPLLVRKKGAADWSFTVKSPDAVSRGLARPPSEIEIMQIHAAPRWRAAARAFSAFAADLVPRDGDRRSEHSPAEIERMRSELWASAAELMEHMDFMDVTDGPSWEPSRRRRTPRAAPYFGLRPYLLAEDFHFGAIIAGYFVDDAVAERADFALLRRCEQESCGRVFVATCQINPYQPEPFCKQLGCGRRRERERKSFARRRMRAAARPGV